MGYLIYGDKEFEFDDRTLAHVKVASSMKLRRQESFFLSWTNDADKGSGRLSLWVSPTVPLVFRFAGNRQPELNQVWIKVLADLSQTARGLVVISEKDAMAYAAQQTAESG